MSSSFIEEFILRLIFERKMASYLGHDIQLFKRFQLTRNELDTTKFTIGAETTMLS